MDSLGVDVIAITLSLPLFASVLLNAWDYLWTGQMEGPLSRRNHFLLLAMEFLMAVWLTLGAAQATAFAFAGGLYGMLAGGALTIRLRRGRVPCGCWGSRDSRISGWLIGMNVILAILAVSTVGLARSPSLVAGIGRFASVLALSTLLFLVIPETVPLLRVLRERARPYLDWLRDFPELEVR